MTASTLFATFMSVSSATTPHQEAPMSELNPEVAAAFPASGVRTVTTPSGKTLSVPASSDVAADHLRRMFPRVDYTIRYSGEGELTHADGQPLVSFAYDTETGAVTIPNIEGAIAQVEAAQEDLQDQERDLETRIQELQAQLRKTKDEGMTVARVLRSLDILDAAGHGS